LLARTPTELSINRPIKERHMSKVVIARDSDLGGLRPVKVDGVRVGRVEVTTAGNGGKPYVNYYPDPVGGAAIHYASLAELRRELQRRVEKSIHHNSTQRLDGYYWIDGSEGLEPAQWLNGKWYTIGGQRGFSDDEVTGVWHRIEYDPKQYGCGEGELCADCGRRGHLHNIRGKDVCSGCLDQ
jgi:hypothetical protein